jgi:diguanylate cyclase (GGDEF)-like protein
MKNIGQDKVDDSMNQEFDFSSLDNNQDSQVKNELMRKRVEMLRDHDYKRNGEPERDSVHDLAEFEGEKRDKYLKFGATNMEAASEADEASTERLLRIEAEHEKVKDDLTGLFNRKGLFGQGVKNISLELRNNKNFVVLMLDIDKFKSVNDNYGHGVGDEVLKRVTEIANQDLRMADTLYRWGGEEFVAVLTDTDLSGGVLAADKIRKKIENTPIVVEGLKEPLKMTISIGVFGSEQDDDWRKAMNSENPKAKSLKKNLEKRAQDKLEEIIVRADIALLSAKEAGRNRVTIYNDSLKINKK